MLDVNKIEQIRKCRKSYFPKSVSIAFVAHCSFHVAVFWILK